VIFFPTFFFWKVLGKKSVKGKEKVSCGFLFLLFRRVFSWVALGREKFDRFEGEREDGPNPKYAKSLEK
jgi:hypothetical protein